MHVKFCHFNWFNKTLIDQKPGWSIGGVTKLRTMGRRAESAVTRHGSGDECVMQIKVLPHGRM